MITQAATCPRTPQISTAHRRLLCIDALRGLVILFMLLDHVPETFFVHRQLSDPMTIETTEPALFASRLAAHLCAPAFVLLTGLSAWLYGQRQTDPNAVSRFLFKRGVFLIVLELTLVNFAWTLQLSPATIYLQVIWAIGISMVALAALCRLPRVGLGVIGLAIVAGHNLLDPIGFAPGDNLYPLWSILHDRGWLTLGDSVQLRTSYPVLPWVGVIAIGYVLGPWFASATRHDARRLRLIGAGSASLLLFAVLRLYNGYGDQPWQSDAAFGQTLMHFFNLTKYPPSLLFIALTVGVSLLLLWLFERFQHQRWIAPLVVFGSAPMFFYLLHLYVLKFAAIGAAALWAQPGADYVGMSAVWQLWLCAGLLSLALYWPVKRFARFKKERRDITWLAYF